LTDDENLGFSEQEIAEVENRLSVKLPEELRNYYLTLGNNENINYSHNRLLKPDKEIGFSNDRYLIFYEENQVVVYWGIKEEDLKFSNPKVWGNYGTEDSPDWHKEANSTDIFFLLMAIYNGTLGGLKYHANSFENIKNETISFIEQNWTEVPEISWKNQKVYTNAFDEVISVSFNEEGNANGIFIGTSNQEKFDELLNKLEIDWSYSSYEDEEE
jgi:hypothetical protein